MTNIQYIINNLRNIIDSIEYLKKSDYDKLSTEIDFLEQDILYRDEYQDYINDIDEYNEIDENEDFYNYYSYNYKDKGAL